MAFNNRDLAKSVGEAMRAQQQQGKQQPEASELIDSKDLEIMDADKITRFYRIPSARFKTVEQLITYYGYRLGDKLAEGGFGQIFLATHVKTGITVACKQMDLSKCE